MIRLLWLAISKSWLEQFPSRAVYLAELLASALDVLFYYFTAKAFGGALVNLLGTTVHKFDYFEFIIWNEAVLSLPVAALLAPTRVVRSASMDGTWQILLTAPRTITSILVLLSQADFARQAARMALMIILAVGLGAEFSLQLVATAILLLVIGLPLFTSIGIIAAAAYIRLQRGFGALNHLSHIIMVLAGAYFPLTVLPSWIATLSRALSPWTWFLEGTRLERPLAQIIVYLLVSGLISSICATKLLKLSVQHQRNFGQPILNL